MRNPLHNLIIIFIALFCSACINGRGVTPQQGVRVSTTPSGATATSSYGNSCTTPCVLFLPTDNGGEIVVEKDGYHSETVQIDAKFDRFSATTDAAFDSVYPEDAAIDLAFLAVFGKGSYQKLDTHRLNITLTPLVADNQDTPIVQ